MKKRVLAIAISLFVSTFVGPAGAEIIDFTGGTAYLLPSGTGTTDNSNLYGNVDYYEEGGFRLDFIGGAGIIGPYYGMANDVIHGHWDTGDYGTLTEIRVSKLDNTTFDLNYFVLTSNTDTGGGAASGLERAYINASTDGATVSYSQLLPSDDWGWVGPNPQIFLGSQFDSIYWFSFTVANAVDCFGMDNFYIDEPAPQVPEPSTLFLLGSGIAMLAGLRMKMRG